MSETADTPTAHLIQQLAIAGLGVVPGSPAGAPMVLVPPSYKLVSLEQFGSGPSLPRGIYTVNDSASFINLAARMEIAHSVQGMPIVYIDDGDAPKFTAVLNPSGWGDLRVVHKLPVSKEWQTWTQNSHKPMTQVEYAHFIESNLPDMHEPPGADMLTIARSLEAKKSVNFSSGVRLDNGDVQLTYEEDTKATAAKGALAIPDEFKIAVSVFKGDDRYQVLARFRYRIEGCGKLFLWYELDRAHKIIESALKDKVNRLRESLPNYMYVNGEPATIKPLAP
jgi:uncharacterized protein YfdQ (DUF2303 family)